MYVQSSTAGSSSAKGDEGVLVEDEKVLMQRQIEALKLQLGQQATTTTTSRLTDRHQTQEGAMISSLLYRSSLSLYLHLLLFSSITALFFFCSVCM